MVLKFPQKLLLVNFAASGLSGSDVGFSFGIISSQILIWWLFNNYYTYTPNFTCLYDVSLL